MRYLQRGASARLASRILSLVGAILGEVAAYEIGCHERSRRTSSSAGGLGKPFKPYSRMIEWTSLWLAITPWPSRSSAATLT